METCIIYVAILRASGLMMHRLHTTQNLLDDQLAILY